MSSTALYFGLSIFDLCIVGVSFLSGLHACIRGFIREVLSIIAWVGAFLVALRFAPPANVFLAQNYFDPLGYTFPDWFSLAVISILLALGSFLSISMLSEVLLRAVRAARTGFIDRLLGFGFGIVRALVMIALLYALYTFFVPEEDYPAAMKLSRFAPLLDAILNILQSLLPPITAEAYSISPAGDSL